MKLLETSAFRLAIQFSVIFTIIASAALGYVYFVTFAEIKEQVDQELIHELHELKTHYDNNNLNALKEHINKRQQYGKHLHHYYALADTSLNLIAGSRFLPPLVNKKPVNSANTYFSDAYDFEHGNGDDNDLRIAFLSIENKYFLISAQSNSSIEELQEHTISAILMAIVITLSTSFMIGLYMARQSLCKINNINEGLEKSFTNNFKLPLPVPDKEDEFHVLTLKLNLMIERIEALITGMKQVTDNIAHDLRSPLTRMRNRLEVTLLQSRNESEYRQAMERAIEDCNDLLKTFNALLSIAQAEAGVKRDNWQSIDLAELLDDLVELYLIVAEEKGLTLQWHKTAPILVTGHKHLMAQAMSNLLENAIKFTPASGKISLSLYTEDGHPVIEVRDSGPGIPEQYRKKALQRFQRLDSSRSTTGSGLGLSLVNAVVKLHSAKLELLDNKPGLCVKIVFPFVSK